MGKSEKSNRTIFTVPEAHRTRTSDVLLSLIERSRSAPVTLRILTDRMGDRTFGMLLILVSIFNVIPFVSSLAGLVIVCLGIQMSIGRTTVWLPSMILDRQLHNESVAIALEAFEPRVRAIERYLRPRLPFTEAYIVDRINGLLITILGAIITLPIPFTNLGPAVVVVVMGLGLLERDGLVQICAAALGILLIVGISYFLYGQF